MIPGSGRSTGEGIGYPLQYSWASLVAQLVKNAPAMQETRVQSLSWEDPLEKGKGTHCSILAWKIPWTTVHGVARSQTQLSSFHFLSMHMVKNPPARAGDTGDGDSVPGLGRSPRPGDGNTLKYSCLENPMNRRAWQAIVHRVAKSRT